jgi:hypothetical protein
LKAYKRLDEKLGDRPKVPKQFPMAFQDVLLGSATISVSRPRALKNCETFQDTPGLLNSLYYNRLAVVEETLRTCLAAFTGRARAHDNKHERAFFALRGVRACGAFPQVSEFRLQHTVVDDESGTRVYTIEEQILQ